MTLNEALTKQTFIAKLLLKNGENELSKELKVKVMGARIKLLKLRKEFDEDVKVAIEDLKPEGFDELSQKENKSEDEQKELDAKVAKINEEYNLFALELGKKEVDFDFKFTEDEYFEQIVGVNGSNDVEINGNTLPAADFLEVVYSLFV